MPVVINEFEVVPEPAPQPAASAAAAAPPAPAAPQIERLLAAMIARAQRARAY
jgi:hypothetical protein